MSTSSSDGSTRATRAATLSRLVALLLVFLAGVEVVTRLGFDRVSSIQLRTRGEWSRALQPFDGRRPVILFVGNSLLGAGLSTRELERKVADRYDTRRLVVEDTRYYDWVFGAGRLAAEGARPHVLVFTLSESQLVTPGLRGDYAARYLVRGSDLPEAARVAGYDRTRTASFMLAHFSAFWAVRVELRKWLLDLFVPPAPELLRGLARVPASSPETAIGATALSRLRLLATLGLRLETSVCLLVPPTPKAVGTAAVVQAGRLASVPVIVPIPPESMDLSCYEDGLHLNARGATLFTTAVAGSIDELVSSLPGSVTARDAGSRVMGER